MRETIRPNQRPQVRKPEPTPRRPANQKPPGELGKKGNKRIEEGEGTGRLALPRVRRMPPRPTPPRPTLAKPKKSRKKPSRKPCRKPQRGIVGTVLAERILPKLRTITAIRRAIMPSTALSRKTSGRWPPRDPATRFLHSMPGPGWRDKGLDWRR